MEQPENLIWFLISEQGRMRAIKSLKFNLFFNLLDDLASKFSIYNQITYVLTE